MKKYQIMAAFRNSYAQIRSNSSLKDYGFVAATPKCHLLGCPEKDTGGNR